MVFAEKSGRCGRDGKLSTSVGIASSKYVRKGTESHLNGKMVKNVVIKKSTSNIDSYVKEKSESCNENSYKLGSMTRWMTGSQDNCLRWLLNLLFNFIWKKRF